MAQLPSIYPDESSIRVFRERYSNELVKLLGKVSLETSKDIAMAAQAVGSQQPFFLASQGLNDRELQKIYGDLVCKVMAAKYPQFSEGRFASNYLSGEPIRIGVVSDTFFIIQTGKFL